MQYQKLLENILLICFAQGFIVTLFVIGAKFYRSRRVWFLTLMVLTLSLNSFQAWMKLGERKWPFEWMHYVHFPWYILVVPFFYMFVRSFTGDFKPAKRILHIAYLLFAFSVVFTSFLYFKFHNRPGELKALLYRFNMTAEFVGLLFNTAVLILAWKFYVQNQKEFSKYLNINWLKKSFPLAFVLFFIWFVAIVSTYLLRDYGYFEEIYNGIRVSSAIIIYWIVYAGIYRFSTSKDSTNKPEFTEKHKLEYEKLVTLIREKELYTDTELTVQKLAKYLDISPAKLSKLIQHFGGKSVPEMINGMRVERAKELLQDPEFEKYTLAHIGWEAGFNSRSAFYNHFKKLTGMTPKEFKEQQKNK